MHFFFELQFEYAINKIVILVPTFIHIAWAYFACVAQLLCVGIIQLNSYWLLIVLIVVQQILLLYFEHDNLWFVYRS